MSSATIARELLHVQLILAASRTHGAMRDASEGDAEALSILGQYLVHLDRESWVLYASTVDAVLDSPHCLHLIDGRCRESRKYHIMIGAGIASTRQSQYNSKENNNYERQ